MRSAFSAIHQPYKNGGTEDGPTSIDSREIIVTDDTGVEGSKSRKQDAPPEEERFTVAFCVPELFGGHKVSDQHQDLRQNVGNNPGAFKAPYEHCPDHHNDTRDV
ncbi:MAG: hypothetical protein RLZZ347_447 [Candidatus Parcubacteria bacterium]